MVSFGAFWLFFSTIQLPVLHARTKLVLLPLQFDVVFQADDND